METAWAQVEFIMQHDSVRGHLAAAFIHERKDLDSLAAEAALLNAVASDTTNLLAQLRLAGFYVRMGIRDRAVSVLTSAADGGDRAALLNLGWLGGGAGAFRSILADDPHDAEALFFLAERHLASADLDLADSLTTALEDITGECPEIEYLQAIRVSVTNYEPTQAAFDGLENYLNSGPCIHYDPCWANPHLLAGIHSHRPMRARAHYRLSNFYRRIPGKSKDFRKQAERALELDPTCSRARQILKMPTGY
jgi:hypothetical protein